MFQKPPTVTFACARSPSVHPQAEEVRQHKAARHQAFVDRHESAIANAVPLGVRLQILLCEGRTFEQALVDRSDSPCSSFAIKKRQCIDAGYRNLILDVKRRAAIIDQQDTPPEHQFMLGSEAIGCFSSMLPWTDGIVSVNSEPVMTPVVFNVPSFSFRDGRPAPMPHRRRFDMKIARAASVELTNIQWTFPSRLATDTRKLAQITAARRKRLQSLAVSSPRGASVAELPVVVDGCRAQTMAA